MTQGVITNIRNISHTEKYPNDMKLWFLATDAEPAFIECRHPSNKKSGRFRQSDRTNHN
jgi:hypothetical protein